MESQQHPPLHHSDLLDHIEERLRELLARLGIEGSLHVHDERANEVPHVRVDVTSEESGILIGEHGIHLRAFEHVGRLILRGVLPGDCRLVVDVNGYRRKRMEQLRALARDAAHRAVNSHRAVTLQPMSSYERRIVHTTLADAEQIETESVGTGDARRVVIRPRDPLASSTVRAEQHQAAS